MFEIIGMKENDLFVRRRLFSFGESLQASATIPRVIFGNFAKFTQSMTFQSFFFGLMSDMGGFNIHYLVNIMFLCPHTIEWNPDA